MILPIDSATVSAPVLRTISRIATIWQVSDAELAALVDMPLADFKAATAAAQKGETVVLASCALECLGHLLGIYRALDDLFPIESQRMAWLRKPNSAPPFHGIAPLALLLKDAENLLIVRRFLSAWRVGNPPGPSGIDFEPVVEADVTVID